MNETEARALVTAFLYPSEAKIPAKTLENLIKLDLVKPSILQTALCTPKGEKIAIRQLIYLLSLRGMYFKDVRRARATLDNPRGL